MGVPQGHGGGQGAPHWGQAAASPCWEIIANVSVFFASSFFATGIARKPVDKTFCKKQIF
jgi:hypothetical protein